jgi:hypothetical protein
VEEALTYLATLALFSFVLVGAALIRHDMLLLASIPPVFVAMITGFVMALYAQDRFGLPSTGAALVLGVPAAWLCSRRLTNRDLLVCVYLAWAVAMVLALIAFGFPDQG